MPRIVIADFSSYQRRGTCVGHYFAVASNYLQMFADAILAAGPVYARSFPQTEVLPYQPGENHCGIVNKCMALLNLRVLLRKYRHDILILQSRSVATAFFGIALLRPHVRKLVMIQYNKMGLNTPLKRLLYRFASKYIDGIICPTEEIGNAYGRPYCVVPDYIYVPHRQTEEISYMQKRYDFCMVGLICRDKGIVEAARFFASTSCRVLIAGRADTPEIAHELQQLADTAPNIELKLKYLSDEEYEAAIHASRYCMLNYSGAYSEHSSGVVFDILFRGVPVVGRRCQALQFIEEEQTGQLFSDIGEWNAEAVLSEEAYDHFRNHIASYRNSHREHRTRLSDFLMKEK